MSLRPILSLALVGLVVAGTASAQYRTEKHPDLGITSISVPRNFDAVPTQPGERWIQLFYKERAADPEKRSQKKRRYRPELEVIVIPKQAVETGPAAGREDREKITSFSTYAEHRLGEGWKLESLGPGKRDRKLDTQQYGLDYLKSDPRAHFVGYAYTWETPAHFFVLKGRCLEEDYEEMLDLWEKVGDKMKVGEPKDSGSERKKLERYYKQKGYSHTEYRIAVREALVDEWKADDTDNFIVVYHTKDQPLLRKVMRDIELLRLEYMKLFPPAADFDAVSTVRICEDKQEYMAYGGSSRSAGYWNHRAEELVLYDAQKVEKSQRPDDSDTFVVLYHEAFHQYIHYSTGELPPHSWYNEGYGDFFSGAVIKNGKVRKIGPNPWRTWLIKKMVDEGWPTKPVPWRDIIGYSQAQYYANGGPNYAQGWSMVYFLKRSPEVEDRPEWAKILPTYFDTLKQAYADELETRGDPEPGPKRDKAGEEARKLALEKAFEDVDLDEIHRAWEDFVATIEDPREK